MLSELFVVGRSGAGFLAIMARPRSGEWLGDEIAGLGGRGVRVLVSLLEAHEVRELGLAGESEACTEHRIAFRSFPISDRGVPESMAAAATLARELRGAVTAGRGVAIHCRIGLGRSAVLAAVVLLEEGHDVDTALDLISTARRLRVPDTAEQVEWLKRYEAWRMTAWPAPQAR